MDPQPSRELLDRCAELKQALVSYALNGPYVKELDAYRRAAEIAASRKEGMRRNLDEHETITTVDRFILQEKQADGRSVLEAFAAVHRPLAADERAMLLGWSDVVDGCFELARRDGISLLHNLFDGLDYRAHTSAGSFDDLAPGTFVLGRLVPLAPLAGGWLVSGHLAVFDRTARQVVVAGAQRALSTQPGLMKRNPELLGIAWDMQAAARGSWIALHGPELLILPPEKAQEALRAHYQRLLETSVAREPGSAERAPLVPPEEAGFLPDDVLGAADVALVYDEHEGLVVCAGVGRLAELFADPALAKDRARVAVLGEMLRDDSVPPVVFRHLARRNVAGAEAAFKALLGRSFSWDRDSEKLLRRYKPAHFTAEPAPSYPVFPPRLRELMREE